MNLATVQFLLDPLRPWSAPGYGLFLLGGVALLLIGLTLWTYLGLTGRGRVVALVVLRLLALAVALVVLLRPSLAYREERKTPYTLVIALDTSQSMTIQDAAKGQSRWQGLMARLQECEADVQRLRTENEYTVHVFRFAGEVGDFDPAAPADGKRSDYGDMLRTLAERFQHERNLRGLVVVGDGADNGSRFVAVDEAKKWRGLSCPIYTFALGKQQTTSKQNDVALVRLTPAPSPVPVKGKLTVTAVLDAPGFLNLQVRLRLFLDDREVAVEDKLLSRVQDNEVTLTTDAPPNPGEVKVTLKVEPVLGEVTTANNEISTFVSVVKEGISVLLVDKPRFPEPQLIVDALATNPRFRVHTLWLRSDQPSPEHADLFRFDKLHYDVIILGDVTIKRLTGGQPQVLDRIASLVTDKGAGLLLTGGYDTFGNGSADWRNSRLADLAPVQFTGDGQVEGDVRLVPTDEGLKELGYVLRVVDQADDNRRFWDQLPALEGMTKLGPSKPGARVLGRSARGDSMLVRQDVGKGRVLAFAADTTFNWQQLGQPDRDDGLRFHGEFWKHLVIWLAQQENAEGAVRVNPQTRRLAAGSKLGFDVRLMSKDGGELPGGTFDVKVLGPDGVATAVPTAQEEGLERGTFWKTDAVGEYRLVARSSGKDRDGSPVNGEASARFVVYQDDAEMMRQAADYGFLQRLADATDDVRPPTGAREEERAVQAYQLPDFINKLRTESQQQAALPPPTKRWPDWGSRTLRPEPPGLLVAFVAVLGLEWLCRRRWGLV